MNRRRANLGLLLVGFLWGLGFVLTKIALNVGIEPLYMLALRFIMSALVLMIVFRKKLLKLKMRDIKRFIFLGIFLSMAYLLQTVGSQYTTVSKISFYTALNIIFVPYISWLLHKKAPSIYTYLATIVCVIGIGIIAYEPYMEILSFNKGDILVIISALFFGIQVALTGVYSKKYDVDIIVLVEFMTMAVFFIFSIFIKFLIPNMSTGIRMLNSNEFLLILYMGLISTCLCLFLQTLFQKYTNATSASILMSTESLFGPLLASVILFEHLTLNIFIGGVLIVSAVILSEIKSN